MVVSCAMARPTYATPVTWEWEGTVSAYFCANGVSCPTQGALSQTVPVGTTVDVFLTIDPSAPTFPVPQLPCEWGHAASLSFGVLGQTYTNSDVLVFINQASNMGNCTPAGSLTEIIALDWGAGPSAPLLPNGWSDAGANGSLVYIPGIEWTGPLTTTPPNRINARFPFFRNSQFSTEAFESFDLTLVQTPEPSSVVLTISGLAAFLRTRRYRQVVKRL